MSRYTEVFQRSLADYDSPVTGTCVIIGYDQLLAGCTTVLYEGVLDALRTVLHPGS